MTWQYNLTVTKWSDVFLGVQTIVPFFYELATVVTFIICFVSMKNFDTVKAFAASAFLSTLTALFFLLSGVLNVVWFYGMLIMTGISVVLLYFNQ